MRISLAVVLVAGMASAALGGDYDAVRVIGTVPLDGMMAGPANSGALLSPDGASILHVGNSGGEVCLFDVHEDTVTRNACGALADRPRTPEDMYWSPDGQHLVLPTYMTAFMMLRDTDVEVLDLATMSVANLTDDGVRDSLIQRPTGALLDVAAHWIDADTLGFVRYEIPDEGMGSRSAPVLMTVGTDGKPAQRLAKLTDGKGFVYTLDVSSDGQAFAYAVDDRDEPRRSGVFVMRAGDKAPKRVASFAANEGPIGIAFSADGKWLALIRPTQERSGLTVALVEIATGALTQLPSDGPPILGMGWSPTGSALVYVTGLEGTDPGGLFLAEPPDGQGRLLLAGAFMPPVCCGNQPIVWAANDTLVLGNRETMDQPLLVRLGR